MYMRTAVLLLVAGDLAGLFLGVLSQKCVDGDYFGTQNPNNKDDRNDRNNDIGYILPGQASDCCGVVKSWNADFKDRDADKDVHFQVWKPTGVGDTYELMGENIRMITSNAEITYTVPAADKILIKPGYVFGWWNVGREIIGYDDDGGFPGVKYTLPQLTDHVAGDTFDWSVATTTSANTYAIRINVEPDLDPVFDNLPDSTSVTTTDAAGVSLFTISASDPDPGTDTLTMAMVANSEFSFNTATCKHVPRTTDAVEVSMFTISASDPDPDPGTDTLTMVMVANSEFSFNTATWEISTGTLTTTSGSVVLTFDVTDECSNTVRSTYTVNYINPPPVFNGLPTSTNISEDTTVDTVLFNINVTDGEQVTCTLAASVPATDPVAVRLIPSGSGAYGLYLNANPNLDYATKDTYELKVTCTDGVTPVTSDSYWVYLVKNSPPVFTNLQNTVGIATTLGMGAVIFTVTTTDPEGDTLAYTMTCTPPTCPYEILDSGEIVTTMALSTETTVGYDLAITVTDGKNTVGPSTLTVTYTDLNNPVTITNLPLPSGLGIPEVTALGTTIYDVDYLDVDTAQTHTFTMTSAPTDGLNYFSIDSNGVITTAGAIINFETLAATTFTLSITVADPVVSDTQTLPVTIFNVNEPPAFGMDSYGISTVEGTTGTVIGTPSFGITDPDAGDTSTLSMNCGAADSYFVINATTGAVSYQIDYDLDTAATLPTTVNCVVTVTDSGALFDTATLTIYIADANDNTPVFNPASYTFFVSYFAGPQTALGYVTATDADAGSFGVISYSVNQASLSVPHFVIDNTGLLSLQLEPTVGNSALNYSSTYTIQAVVTDSGGLTGTANVVIVISDTTSTTVTTTTYKYKTFFSDDKNLAWFIPCAILVVAAFLTTAYMVYTCRGKHSCAHFLRACMNRRKIKLVLDDNFEPPYREKPHRNPIKLSVRPYPPNEHSWQTQQRF